MDAWGWVLLAVALWFSASALVASLCLVAGRRPQDGGSEKQPASSGQRAATPFTTPLTLRVAAYSSLNTEPGSPWEDRETRLSRLAPNKRGGLTFYGEPEDGNRGAPHPAAGSSRLRRSHLALACIADELREALMLAWFGSG